ncbi:MAG: hypothetical protein ACREIA_16605 [Opitutaceae bacterium]
METQTLSLAAGRKVVLAPFTKTADFDLPRPFVALLPASNAADCRLAEQIIAALIVLGCIEVCCVGPTAELMHNQLDVIIETSGSLDVVTTWFNNERDACEYVLFAAGGGNSSLLALVLDQPELVDILKKTAR